MVLHSQVLNRNKLVWLHSVTIPGSGIAVNDFSTHKLDLLNNHHL